MTCRELDDLITLVREERDRANEEPAGPLLEGPGKRRVEADLKDKLLKSGSIRRLF